jgi:hypothetical protein
MAREQSIGVCEHCRKNFGYYVVHNGFNDSAYAYCDTCEQTTILSRWHNPIPPDVKLRVHRRISSDIEPFLKACPCGGTFRADAGPKCPYCHQALSPLLAREYLEANAPGTKSGWRWQNNWSDVYSIIIENQCVDDWWKL